MYACTFILAILICFYFSYSLYFIFYLISIFILLTRWKTAEAFIHRTSDYADQLPETPRYCCPIYIFYLFFLYNHQAEEVTVKCLSQGHNTHGFRRNRTRDMSIDSLRTVAYGYTTVPTVRLGCCKLCLFAYKSNLSIIFKRPVLHLSYHSSNYRRVVIFVSFTL